MTWQQHEGLPTLGAPLELAPPLIAAVEAHGALLEWPFDAPADARPTITVTEPHDADWLWRLIGEPAHAALFTGAATPPDWDASLALALRRLAHGLWLRTWWPTSPHEAIAGLDAAVLHRELLELIDELEGIVDDAALPRLMTATASTRADYALAATGAGQVEPDGSGAVTIASGTATVAWQSVPGGLVDATEEPLHWIVDAAAPPTLRLAVLPAGDPADCAGLRVTVLRDGAVLAAGELDHEARASLALPLTAAEAWAVDWTGVDVRLGALVDEPPALRERIRAFARGRRGAEDALAFDAEADDDY